MRNLDDCIFCRIATGQLPATFEYEDERIVAFRDLNPQAPVHVLVIPRQHYGSIHDVPTRDSAIVGELTEAARRIAERLGVWPGGYRLVFNTGPDGGQTVGHLHMHLLGGRQMVWPPG